MQESCQNTAKDGEAGAIRVEAGALVIVVPELGSQRRVWHVDGRERGIEAEGDDEIVQELASIAEGRNEPVQEKRKSKGDGARQQPETAATIAGPRSLTPKASLTRVFSRSLVTIDTACVPPDVSVMLRTRVTIQPTAGPQRCQLKMTSFRARFGT